VSFDDLPTPIDGAPPDDRRSAEAWLAAVAPVDAAKSDDAVDADAKYAAIGIESGHRGMDIDGHAPSDLAPTSTTLTQGELVGRAVLRMRLSCGWSQKELERRSGVDQTTISRLERGVQRGLSVRRLFAILCALRVADVTFCPAVPVAPATPLELMLRGDPWERAIRAADARLNRRRSA
jgi:transcriptional regulator with XRE-family HTH domain